MNNIKMITEEQCRIIGKNLGRSREQRGLSQEKVANEIGMSPHYYRRIEHAEANPTIGKLTALATFFGVTVVYLMIEHDE